MSRLPPSLLALSPGDLELSDVAGFLARVDEALAAGLRGILLRETLLSDRACLELVLELRARLDANGSEAGWLGVHDRAHVALSARADGVHAGFRSMPLAALRELVASHSRGSAPVIGFSTHRADDARAWADADYVFHGPVRETVSKRDVPNPPAVVGFDGLRAAVAATDRPVWALGGLTPSDGPSVRCAGAQGLAALSGVFAAGRVGAATRAYLSAWELQE